MANSHPLESMRRLDFFYSPNRLNVAITRARRLLIIIGSTNLIKIGNNDIEKFFMYNFIETVAKVTGQGAASCYYCSYGETCKAGIPYMLYGDGFKIVEENIPDVTKQAEVMQSAVEAGKLLGRRLREDHNRKEVTLRMQQKMMEMMKSAV